MDCPVIAVRHCVDGVKEFVVELPPGDPRRENLKLCQLTVNKLMQELISPQGDGAWARIPVRV